MKLCRSIAEPIREFIDMDHRWRGPDRGLIWCWERGRMLADEDPTLASRARDGELMVLAWRGGVTPGLKIKKKAGTLFYLAQWQGIAGKDLDLDMDGSTTLTCSNTGIEVTYSTEGSADDE